MTVRPIRFDRAAPVDSTAPTTAHEWYADPTGAFSAGFWASQACALPVTYTEDEFCVLLEGTVELVDAAGEIQVFQAGESFLIPAGFTGTWKSVTPVRKFYVIHQPPTG